MCLTGGDSALILGIVIPLVGFLFLVTLLIACATKSCKCFPSTAHNDESVPHTGQTTETNQVTLNAISLKTVYDAYILTSLLFISQDS